MGLTLTVLAEQQAVYKCPNGNQHAGAGGKTKQCFFILCHPGPETEAQEESAGKADRMRPVVDVWQSKPDDGYKDDPYANRGDTHFEVALVRPPVVLVNAAYERAY